MHAPIFREMSPEECRALLERLHVGRIAYVDHNRVDIEPLHYVAQGNWLFARVAEGTKTHALRHRPYAAFEVDEARGLFDWSSVVLHGTIYFLPASGAPVEAHEFARALAALRELIPETLTGGDPAPYREVVLGLHIDAMRGRLAAPSPTDPGTTAATPAGARKKGAGARRKKAPAAKRSAKSRRTARKKGRR